jgi:hypothetical protein
MSTLNNRWDRVDGPSPVIRPATRMLEVVLYMWTLHYKCMWEASASPFMDCITTCERAENVERF